MPYTIVSWGDEFCIYKKDAEGNPIGETFGCHKVREDAEKQLAAIVISEAEKVEVVETNPATATSQDTTIWNGWFTIKKVDAEERIVEGFASTEAPDNQAGVWQGQVYKGDVVTAEAVKAALPDYMKWANLREMHQLSAVGVVLKAEVIEGDVEVGGETYHSPLHIIAKIIDDTAWRKVKEGVYKGFSIGGNVLKAVIDKIGDFIVRKITQLTMVEISLADRPSNPEARIVVWKLAAVEPQAAEKVEKGSGPEKGTPETIAKGVATVAKSTEIKKAAADPAKALGMLQQLRDEAESAGELQDAALYSQAIALLLQATGDAAKETTDEPKSEDAPVEGESVPAEGGAEAPEGALLEEVAKPKLRKAGRTFSGANTAAMHGVIQALAQIMSDAGDEKAAKVLAVYSEGTTEEPAPVAGEVMKLVQAELEKTDILGKVNPLVDELKQVIETLQGRVEKLEALPAPGGPVLRMSDKTIAGQPAPEAPVSNIAELRRKAAIEPDPIRKAEINRQLWAAEQATVKH